MSNGEMEGTWARRGVDITRNAHVARLAGSAVLLLLLLSGLPWQIEYARSISKNQPPARTPVPPPPPTTTSNQDPNACRPSSFMHYEGTRDGFQVQQSKANLKTVQELGSRLSPRTISKAIPQRTETPPALPHPSPPRRHAADLVAGSIGPQSEKKQCHPSESQAVKIKH